MHKRKSQEGAQERSQKNRNAWERKWDPVGAGRRETRAKQARKFLVAFKKDYDSERGNQPLLNIAPLQSQEVHVTKKLPSEETKIQRVYREAAILKERAVKLRGGGGGQRLMKKEERRKKIDPSLSND